MRKIIVGITLAIFIFSLVLPATAQIRKGADIEMSLVSQDPDPVEPGNYVKLRFKIENSGYANVEGVEVELLADYPFSLDPGQEALKTLGIIPGGQTGTKAYTFDYKVRVDKDAVEGDNEIEVRWRAKEGTWVKEKFDVDIETVQTLLVLSEFTSTPEKICPGENVNIKMTLENAEYSYIKDVRIQLEHLQATYSSTGVATYEELPFSPVGNSDEKVIRKIEGEDTAEVEFSLITDADAEPKIYKLPVKITFIDSNEQESEQTNIISLIVGSKPDMVVGIEKSEIYNVGQTGAVTVRFVNKGSSDAKFVYAKLSSRDNYDILSSEDYYIGNIDSDDYETADFKIYAKKADNGFITVPMEYEYMDSNNVKYTKNVDLKIKLLTDEEAKLVGLKKTNPTMGILITIAIVVVGFIIYRKIRKRRKKEKK